jgi:hypothetical protein
LSFRPNAAAVTMDDAADRCESNARACEFFFGMQTLECAKKILGVLGVKSYTIVHHEKNLLVVELLGSNLDNSFAFSTGVFPGIAQQIGHGGLEETGIAPHFQIALDLKVHVSRGIFLTQFLDQALTELREIDFGGD